MQNESDIADARHPAAASARTDLAIGALTATLAIAALLLVSRQVASGGLAEFGDARSPAFLPILGAGALSALSSPWPGFLPTAALLIAAVSRIFGARRPVLVLTLRVAVPVAIQLLFRDVLNVLLPSGMLF